MNFQYAEIERIIGYTFKDKQLLKACFTHKSYSHEKGGADNERLEFLGDSILGFVVADYLYKNNSKKSEGEMTFAKQRLVSKKPLSQAIKAIGLEKYIIFGNSVGNGSGNSAFCENLFESIVAGIYLDGGLQFAKQFIQVFLIDEFIENGDEKQLQDEDYKSALQIQTQAKKLGSPKYELKEKTGPDHNPIFTVGVLINGETVAVGTGHSKNEASKDAARLALKKIQAGNT